MSSTPCQCGGVMFGDGNAHTRTCPCFEGDATPPAPSELEVLDARRYFGGRLTGEEQAALDAVDLAGVNHAPPAPPEDPMEGVSLPLALAKSYAQKVLAPNERPACPTHGQMSMVDGPFLIEDRLGRAWLCPACIGEFYPAAHLPAPPAEPPGGSRPNRQEHPKSAGALSPPPDVERLKDAFFRGWGGGFTALRNADLEFQRQQDWEHFAAWALTPSTPGEAHPPAVAGEDARLKLHARVRDYLGNGGFWNPELMEHDKVRQLIMDLDAELLRGTTPTPGAE